MSLVYKGNIVSRIKPWHLNQCPAAAHHTLSQGGNCILSGGEGVDHAPRLCSGWKWNSSLWKKCKTVTKKNIIAHRRSQERQWSRKFSAYLIILCFEKRRPKQKYCFSPKSNISTPSKFFPPKNLWLAALLSSLSNLFTTLWINDRSNPMSIAICTIGDCMASS